VKDTRQGATPLSHVSWIGHAGAFLYFCIKQVHVGSSFVLMVRRWRLPGRLNAQSNPSIALRDSRRGIMICWKKFDPNCCSVIDQFCRSSSWVRWTTSTSGSAKAPGPLGLQRVFPLLFSPSLTLALPNIPLGTSRCHVGWDLSRTV
jgi:hypothetical protein